ncbi:MAG: spore coat protein [Clostridiales bacterium]|jgi:spore coat protein CotF|nr:spore coat protein [Clostridiales bacterium]
MNTATFTEKDYLQEMLNLEKTIVKTYGEMITESACPQLRTLLNRNFDEAGEIQFNVYTAMADKGYYKVKPAPMQDITEAKTAADTFKQEISKLKVES